MIQAVLFDLDGTLADTALDLGGALNRLLARNGLPAVPMAQIRPVASHGANYLIKLGTGIEKGHPDHPRWRQEYLAEYEHGFCDETVLFEGINPMLEQLARRSIVWGIITNKPHRFTSLLVPELGFIAPPAVVVSGDTCAESKPSTLPMHHACRYCAGALPVCGRCRARYGGGQKRWDGDCLGQLGLHCRERPGARMAG